MCVFFGFTLPVFVFFLCVFRSCVFVCFFPVFLLGLSGFPWLPFRFLFIFQITHLDFFFVRLVFTWTSPAPFSYLCCSTSFGSTASKFIVCILVSCFLLLAKDITISNDDKSQKFFCFLFFFSNVKGI